MRTVIGVCSRGVIGLAALILLGTVPAWAAIGSCPPNGTLSALNNYAGAGDGCATTDGQFSNFSVGSAAGDVIPVSPNYTVLPDTLQAGDCALGFICPPDNTQVYLTTSATEPGTIEISSPGPDTKKPDQGDCTANSGNGGFCLSNGTGTTSQYESRAIDFTVDFTNPTSVLGMYVTAISHSSSGGGSGGAAIVYMEICPGVATFTDGCTGEQVIQAGSVNGNFNKTQISVSATFTPETEFGVQEVILLSTTQSAGDFSSIVNFGLIDTPEPATFSLLGAGLIGLGFLRVRRKKA